MRLNSVLSGRHSSSRSLQSINRVSWTGGSHRSFTIHGRDKFKSMMWYKDFMLDNISSRRISAIYVSFCRSSPDTRCASRKFSRISLPRDQLNEVWLVQRPSSKRAGRFLPNFDCRTCIEEDEQPSDALNIK
jgi:hypothetical protein